MERRLVLNISNFLPIFGQINDEMKFKIQDLLEGSIQTKDFVNYLKKRFQQKNLQIEVSSNEKNEILVKIESIYDLPEQNELERHIKNYFTFEIGEILINKYTGRKIIYITKQSGIPLIGNLSFGILLHNTNIIEIRPVTGCPLQCIFCSVDEGKNSKMRVDYIVEPNYLIEEIRKVINVLGSNQLEAHISAQGEPTIYPHLVELISKLSKLPGIQIISIQTNGVPLTEEYIDKLEKAGLTRINLSINSLDPKKSKQLANSASYDIENIKKIAKYVAKSKIDLILTPIIIPGKNEEDIDEIIRFSKKIGAGKNCPPLGIQNYLIYQFGRKIPKVKPFSWKKFYDYLRQLEKKHEIKPLVLNKKDFNINRRKNPPKPFSKGDIVDIKIATYGRRKNQMMGVQSGRTIQIIKIQKKIGEKIKVRIIKTERNIIVAEPIR
ncbi:MAG: radical SAM protein [Candidatus Helarchaeota archaeon]|nr:radical SAM protein [Candidatus Helarchaeota archaeon]